MSTVGVRADKGSLTRFLGWFSIGLGGAQLIAPRRRGCSAEQSAQIRREARRS